jgi:RNA polymerase sigma-70 factor (ECF subfamily)
LDQTLAGLAANPIDPVRSSPESALFEIARPSGQLMRPSGLLGTLAVKPLWVAATAFLLGGATGAGLYASMRAPVERVVYVDRPVSTPEPSVFAPSPSELNAAPVAAQGRDEEKNAAGAQPVPARVAAPSPVPSGLAAERELLDRARKALGSGDGTDAARTLQLHARRFPSGFLVEEREALTIKTTVEKGQIEEARKLGLKFRERYPKSLFGPAVDDALGTNP